MYILCRKLADGNRVTMTLRNDQIKYTSVEIQMARKDALMLNNSLSDYERQWPWFVQEIELG